MTQLERLYDFAYSFALCPCCTEDRVCDPECTFKQDCEQVGKIAYWERMVRAREAIHGPAGSVPDAK